MRQTLPLWSESRSFLFIEATLVFLIHCAAFWWIFGSGSLPIGGDGYFHYAIASQLNASNLYQSIEALPFTLLGEHGPDLHWLTHWLQKPFTVLFPDTVPGFALATIAWGAMVPALICAILRAYHIPFAALIAAIGIWGLYLLPDRLLMFRAQNAAIIMVIVLTLLMSAQRYIWIGVFIFFFNHAYQGVVLAGAVGFSALLSHALVYKKFDRHLISASLAGVLLSLLTSPWFPDNIQYFLVVMLGRIFSPLENISLMGSEWLPLGPVTLLKLGVIGHACLIISWVILWKHWSDGKSKVTVQRTLTLAILSTIFLILYAKHWRMGEFYGPISAVSFGFCLALIKKRKNLFITAMVLVLSLMTLLHQSVKKPDVVAITNKYNSQCRHLNEHALPGALVFNLSWTAFPYLYHCAPHLRYIAGLDGMLLSQGNFEVFRTWYHLYRGELEKLNDVSVSATFKSTHTSYLLLEPGSINTVSWVLTHIGGSKLLLADNNGYILSTGKEDSSN